MAEHHTQDAELLPCPFCGSHDIIETSNGTDNMFYECSCGTSGPPEATCAKMIAAWNRRSIPQGDEPAKAARESGNPLDNYMEASIELDAMTDNFYGQGAPEPAKAAAQGDDRTGLASELRSAAKLLRQVLHAAPGTASWKDSAQSAACDKAAAIFEAQGDELPPLPDTEYASALEYPLFTEDQMREYGAACRAGRAKGEVTQGDAIAKSKRILALVDDYTEAHFIGNTDKARNARTELRGALMAEFGAKGEDARDAALEEAARVCGKIGASDIGEEGTKAALDCLLGIRNLKSGDAARSNQTGGKDGNG